MKNDNGFLPSGFDLDQRVSSFLKLEEGTHVIVIMPANEVDEGNSVSGWQWWTEDDSGRHPHRALEKDGVPEEETGKQFLAFKVWNKTHHDKTGEFLFQLSEVTQKTIMKAIAGLVDDPDWGDPVMSYPIQIVRKGTDINTEYTVTPKPKQSLPEGLQEAFDGWHCDLTRMYDGGDPFSVSELPF